MLLIAPKCLSVFARKFHQLIQLRCLLGYKDEHENNECSNHNSGKIRVREDVAVPDGGNRDNHEVERGIICQRLILGHINNESEIQKTECMDNSSSDKHNGDNST